jgi:hypothetical protein
MPLLRVSVDGTQVAAVSTEGLNVLAANFNGTKIDEEFSSLELSGGRYPAEGESTHLVWLNGLVVYPGQRVRVEFVASGSSSHAGKTMAELFPGDSEDKDDGEDGDESQDFPLSRDAVLDDVAARPQVRTAYHFDLESSSGAKCATSISAQEHGFGVSFLWNSVRAERVSASLHTFSLEQLRAHGEFTYHWREHLVAGDWAEVAIEG